MTHARMTIAKEARQRLECAPMFLPRDIEGVISAQRVTLHPKDAAALGVEPEVRLYLTPTSVGVDYQQIGVPPHGVDWVTFEANSVDAVRIASLAMNHPGNLAMTLLIEDLEHNADFREWTAEAA